MSRDDLGVDRFSELNQYNVLEWGGAMTLVLAIKGSDGIVVAADKRLSYEKPYPNYSDGIDKTRQIGRNCVVATAGDAAVGLGALERFVHASGPYLPKKRVDAREIASALSGFVKNEMRRFESTENDRALQLLQGSKYIVAGFADNDEGEPQPKIEKLCSEFRFEPIECPLRGSAWYSCSAGLEELVPYYEKLLGCSPIELETDRIDRFALFILGETNRATPLVGPTVELRHVFPSEVKRVDPAVILKEIAPIRDEIRCAVERLLSQPSN